MVVSPPSQMHRLEQKANERLKGEEVASYAALCMNSGHLRSEKGQSWLAEVRVGTSYLGCRSYGDGPVLAVMGFCGWLNVAAFSLIFISTRGFEELRERGLYRRTSPIR